MIVKQKRKDEAVGQLIKLAIFAPQIFRARWLKRIQKKRY